MTSFTLGVNCDDTNIVCAFCERFTFTSQDLPTQQHGTCQHLRGEWNTKLVWYIKCIVKGNLESIFPLNHDTGNQGRDQHFLSSLELCYSVSLLLVFHEVFYCFLHLLLTSCCSVKKRIHLLTSVLEALFSFTCTIYYKICKKMSMTVFFFIRSTFKF